MKLPDRRHGPKPECNHLLWHVVAGIQGDPTYPALSFQVIENWLQLIQPHVHANAQFFAIQIPAAPNKIPEDLILRSLWRSSH